MQEFPNCVDYDSWLKSFGIEQFDLDLEAGSDKLIHEVVVEMPFWSESLTVLQNSVVWGEIGEGKTTCRTRLAGFCREGEKMNQIFPVTIRISTLKPEDINCLLNQGPIDDIVLRGAALGHFLETVFRPDNFFALERKSQERVVAFWKQYLIINFDYFLQRLEGGEDVEELTRIYEPGFSMSNPPSKETQRKVTTAIKDISGEGDFSFSLIDLPWLAETRGRKEVFVLIDGLDEIAETAHDLSAQRKIITPLIRQIERLSGEGVYFKAFLPSSSKEHLGTLVGKEAEISIEWTRESLRALVKSRFAVALQYSESDMDMLASPGSRNLSDRVIDFIIKSAGPNPRELIFFIRCVFEQHVMRAGPVGNITTEDIELAKKFYLEHQVN